MRPLAPAGSGPVRWQSVPCRTDRGRPAADAGGVPDSPPPAENDAARARARARRTSLSRWENEGGAGPGRAATQCNAIGSVEAAQLRMRVIALENLVIALFADPSAHQRLTAAGMGEFISPRAGSTPHPLTLRAAEAMRSLLERADRFRPELPE